MGYSPQSSKKSDISEHTHTRYSQYIYGGSGLVAKLCPTLVTPWTIAHQAPLSMEFPRQKYWRNLPFPAPRKLSNPRIEPASPSLQADSLLNESPGNPIYIFVFICICMYICIYIHNGILLSH